MTIKNGDAVDFYTPYARTPLHAIVTSEPAAGFVNLAVFWSGGDTSAQQLVPLLGATDSVSDDASYCTLPGVVVAGHVHDTAFADTVPPPIEPEAPAPAVADEHHEEPTQA